jgi:hypothetical protein
MQERPRAVRRGVPEQRERCSYAAVTFSPSAG